MIEKGTGKCTLFICSNMHGLINAYILVYALAYTSNKLGLHIYAAPLFLKGFSRTNFLLFPWEMIFFQYLLWMLLWNQ